MIMQLPNRFNLAKGQKIFLTVCLLLFVSAGIFSFPKNTKAQLAVTDPGNTVQGTISATANVAQEVSNYSQNYKETVLDPIAYSVAKTILRQVTTSVVEWINTGFEGSPAFLTNPGGFFRNLASEEIGAFVEQNSDLQFLCSPYSINIRLALAFRYRPFKKRVTCTLDQIIQNTVGAVKGASINGLTAGDFSQGKWPAFVSLSTEPQNNVYGAFMEADAELDARLGDKLSRKKEELNQGKGFLSYSKCQDVATQGAGPEIGPPAPPIPTGNTVNADIYQDGSTYSKTKKGPDGSKITQKCQVYTPGSVIAGGLETSLGSPVRELELADEFNEIVNALFAQLLKQVITGGLSGVSGNGHSDPNSFLNQVNSEKSNSLPVLIRELKKNVDTYLKREVEYKKAWESNLKLVTDSEARYRIALKCFTDKASSTAALVYQREELTDYANQVRQTISDGIVPEKNLIITKVNEASSTISILNEFKIKAGTATSTSALQAISDTYLSLITNGQLHDASDLADAKLVKRDEIIDYLNALNPTSAEYKLQCDRYILGVGAGGR